MLLWSRVAVRGLLTAEPSRHLVLFKFAPLSATVLTDEKRMTALMPGPSNI